jgi:putative protease
MVNEKLVGKVTHYFNNIGVAVVKLSATLKKGDKIHIVGPTTDVKQTASSMQINLKPLAEVKKGKDVGLKVKDRVRAGDAVYTIN